MNMNGNSFHCGTAPSMNGQHTFLSNIIQGKTRVSEFIWIHLYVELYFALYWTTNVLRSLNWFKKFHTFRLMITMTVMMVMIMITKDQPIQTEIETLKTNFRVVRMVNKWLKCISVQIHQGKQKLLNCFSSFFEVYFFIYMLNYILPYLSFVSAYDDHEGQYVDDHDNEEPTNVNRNRNIKN